MHVEAFVLFEPRPHFRMSVRGGCHCGEMLAKVRKLIPSASLQNISS